MSLVGSFSVVARHPVRTTQTASLDPIPVELGLVAFAVDLQGTLFADGVGALEDPVLPGGEPAEDTGEHVFGSVEAQVGLHAREGVRRHGHALLDGDTYFVGPVDVVGICCD